MDNENKLEIGIKAGDVLWLVLSNYKIRKCVVESLKEDEHWDYHLHITLLPYDENGKKKPRRKVTINKDNWGKGWACEKKQLDYNLYFELADAIHNIDRSTRANVTIATRALQRTRQIRSEAVKVAQVWAGK